MGCESRLSERPRASLVEKDWECDGSDLVVAYRATATMAPVVIRADLLVYLQDVERKAIRDITGEPEPFAGGDHHLHLVLHLPLRKPEPW